MSSPSIVAFETTSLPLPLPLPLPSPPVTPPLSTTARLGISFLSLSPPPTPPQRRRTTPLNSRLFSPSKLEPPIKFTESSSTTLSTDDDQDEEENELVKFSISPSSLLSSFSSRNPFLEILNRADNDAELSGRQRREDGEQLLGCQSDGEWVEEGGGGGQVGIKPSCQRHPFSIPTNKATTSETNEERVQLSTPLPISSPNRTLFLASKKSSTLASPRSPRQRRRRPSTYSITASSPRKKSPRSPPITSSGVVNSTLNSRRSSSIIMTIKHSPQGYTHYPTSPIKFPYQSSALEPRRSSRKSKDNRNSKSKTRSIHPNPSTRRKPRPIVKTVEGFDAEALDLFFGVSKSVVKARKGGYEEIAMNQGILRERGRGGDDEREQWRKVEEFRGLLDREEEEEEEEEFDEREEEEVEHEEEILHIRSIAPTDSSTASSTELFLTLPPPTSRQPRRRLRSRQALRPPPLQLSHSNNSFTSLSSSTISTSREDLSRSEPSSFSPETSPSDHSDSSLSTRSPLDPISKEISRRCQPRELSDSLSRIDRDRSIEVDRVDQKNLGDEKGKMKKTLKSKKSVGERLKSLCRF